GILNTEADALASSPPQELSQRIDAALALDDDKTSVFALFSADGTWIAGNLRAAPPALRVGGRPVEISPTPTFPANARLIARSLPSGDELVVGRDVNQLREIRRIIASALIWSGVLIILVGLACGTALSIGPLQRLRTLQAAGRDIAGGNLKRRMPTSNRRDELDMFAATVNYMMDEVERLMSEVKGSTDTIAHDLRTPLTRARAQLHRIRQGPTIEPEDIARVTAEIDEVLERFRALLRISELEVRERRASFAPADLADIVERVVDLYQPLAEAKGVRLSAGERRRVTVEADPKLLFEAISNLVDNAIKFTGDGGVVEVRLGRDPARPEIIVRDNGPGIPAGEQTAVLQRFYRGQRDRLTSGSGLGLSIVAAIMRLHGFELVLRDAQPGLEAVIACRSADMAF
ncbi:MAG TPA: HAMP domain-containing sensor histidine kinase, partial [Caulobacteraceae bacterium]|nr:HAMP domain-containing sensor histidine kinase [Caulobacteraceae bacterium]